MKIENLGLSISFLDLLTCAIGGLMVILIIFMTLEHRGEKVTLVSEDENKGRLVIPLEQAVLGNNEISAYLYEVNIKQYKIQPEAEITISDTLNDKGIELIALNKNKSNYLVLIDQPKNIDGKINLVIQGDYNIPLEIVVKMLIGPEQSIEKSYIIPAGSRIMKPFLFNEASGLFLDDKYLKREYNYEKI